jgi:uncharacterized protein with HEPN domain
MYNPGRKDFYYIQNMLDAIAKINAYTSVFKSADEFYEASQAFDATLMNFIVIGEMADKLSEELKDTTGSRLDWIRIRGFRNILAHNYFGVDARRKFGKSFIVVCRSYALNWKNG